MIIDEEKGEQMKKNEDSKEPLNEQKNSSENPEGNTENPKNNADQKNEEVEFIQVKF